jgi:hypothetical protein
MTAIEYAEKPFAENSLGLHYSGLALPAPCKSITCAAKSRRGQAESAKLG